MYVHVGGAADIYADNCVSCDKYTGFPLPGKPASCYHPQPSSLSLLKAGHTSTDQQFSRTSGVMLLRSEGSGTARFWALCPAAVVRCVRVMWGSPGESPAPGGLPSFLQRTVWARENLYPAEAGRGKFKQPQPSAQVPATLPWNQFTIFYNGGSQWVVPNQRHQGKGKFLAPPQTSWTRGSGVEPSGVVGFNKPSRCSWCQLVWEPQPEKSDLGVCKLLQAQDRRAMKE